jgi:hypothetical protein
MLTPMDLAAAWAGPWLVLGVVIGLVLAGVLAMAIRAGHRTRPPATAPDQPEQPEQPQGWVDDDLPGFLEQPPGVAPDVRTPESAAPTPDPPLAAPTQRRRVPAHARGGPTAPEPGRVLVLLASVALVLVGIAAALGVATTDGPPTAADPRPSAEQDPRPTWDLPDLTAFPERPEPGDPGAGRLAAASVPIGDDGALARLAFEGVVLERKAVGVAVAYPSVSVTAAEVPGGPALAHVVLPLWNCLTDTAPEDAEAAGCRRLPTEYADLPSPALTVADDGEGLRISGRFATYLRPNGTAPEWTGRVYPLAVRVQPDGKGATGALHLGTERAESVDDLRLSELRRGG